MRRALQRDSAEPISDLAERVAIGMQSSDSAPNGGRIDRTVGCATLVEQAGTRSDGVYRHQNQSTQRGLVQPVPARR